MEEKLPQGWKTEFSKREKRNYFFHADSKTSVWTLDELHIHEAKLKAKATNSSSLATTTSTRLPAEDAFQSMIRAKLETLLTSKSETFVAFDKAYDGEMRYIVHEIALDFPTLVSRDEGYDIDKHVKVYKLGFVPEANVVTIQAKKRPKRVDDPTPKPEDVELLSIGQMKRDRRTLEEYEMDTKKL